jgi:hypothetical protein
MPTTSSTRARTARALAAAAAVALLAAACTAPTAAGPGTGAPAAATDNPFGHVHGMTVDPDSGRILLATHNGLFDVTADPAEKLSPTIDLMGFAAADPGHYYASGHPGEGSDLPNPVGLIHSDDGGKTWEPLSRQGESDFHALTVTGDGVIGYDGQLRITADGRNWSTVQTAIRPVSLAGSATSPVVLAATEEGVQRSADGGTTWALPANAPLLQFTAFADATTAVGVAPNNTVHVSRDAGLTWQQAGEVSAPAWAVTAATEENGGLGIWVATDNGVEHSADSGATFSTHISANGDGNR